MGWNKINNKKPKGWVEYKFGVCQTCRKRPASNRHHIHYEDDISIAKLCRECHKEVTRRNKDAGWKKMAPLTKEERIDIFAIFQDSFRL